ncbi:MAG: ribonuclease P protein component [Clostridia bacterium]|nr:ribonuclease P protein component [Clostridia bacterium]
MKEIAIRENHLYNKTYSRGRRYVGRYIAVYVLKDLAAKRLMRENPEGKYVNRVGITVSKKIGGAVCRNRSKRIIRAAYRALSDELRRGYLVVISARGAIVGRNSQDIEEELSKAFLELGMMSADKTPKTEEK